MIMILKYSLFKSFSLVYPKGVVVVLSHYSSDSCLKDHEKKSFSIHSIFILRANPLVSYIQNINFLAPKIIPAPLPIYPKSCMMIEECALIHPALTLIKSERKFDKLRYCVQRSKIFDQKLFSVPVHVRSLSKVGVSVYRSFSSSSLARVNLNSNLLTDSRTLFSIDSPITTELVKLLSTNKLNSDTQLKVEELLMNQESFLISKEDKRVINYNLPNALLKEIDSQIPSLEKLINNYRQSHSLINNIVYNSGASEVSPNIISTIILNSSDHFILSVLIGRLLKIISNNDRLNENTNSLTVYIDLGNEFISNYLLSLYNESKKGLPFMTFSQWKAQAHNSQLVEISKDQSLCLNIGSLLIGWLKELELVDNKVEVISRVEKHNIIIVGSKLKRLLPDLNKLLQQKPIFVPKKLPMICPPKAYNSNICMNNSNTSPKAAQIAQSAVKSDISSKLGGYLLNDINYTESLILDNWLLASKTSILEDNIIYKMVNSLSSIAFKINIPVLDFILENYKKYNLLVDPDYIHPLALIKDRKLTKSEKQSLESFKSKRDLEVNILGLANIFRAVPAFYFPVRLDYRGRIYCVTEYLNYQGTELSKALLLFSKGERVLKSDTLSINYLKVYGANCFGNGLEKLSFEARIKWVNENEDLIKNFTSPMRCQSLLAKAENKLLFIAFCFEYKNYLDSLNNNKEDSFITHLPIQFDATCNGFQHLTLLIKEITLYKELNLGESKWSDMPKDFYSFVALKLKDYFKNLLEKASVIEGVISDAEADAAVSPLPPELIESYTKLMNINIHRRLVKKPIMTIPYNASAFSIVNYFKEEFNVKKEEGKTVYYYKDDPEIKFYEIDFQSLRKALSVVIFKDYPKLSYLLNYLKEIANISNKLQIQIPWKLPTGLLVQQQYYKTKTLKVKPFLYSKDLLNLKIIEKKKFNSRKQIRAFMPNLIHSLDAASLFLLVNEFFKENKTYNFYSIHDCFAVTCNNVDLMINFLKSAYCIIYSKDNYLLELHNTFLENIKANYGPDCYDPKTNIITIEISSVSQHDQGKKIKLRYPDITKLININEDSLEFLKSSYICH